MSRFRTFAPSIIMVLGLALIGLAPPHVQAAPGDLDLAFGGLGVGGRVVAPQMPGESYGMALQPDGKIVVAGESQSDIVVMRYLPDGTLDTTFSSDGIAVLSQVTGLLVRDVAVQADGKIVVAGGYDTATSDFVLARVTSTGLLDVTFGGIGFVSTGFVPEDDDIASAVLVQPDGKIVAAGTSSRGPTLRAFAVARYNSNGSLDATFATSGRTAFFPPPISVIVTTSRCRATGSWFWLVPAWWARTMTLR